MDDISRHWDNICFGILTLATAALAALLLVAGFADTADEYADNVSRNLNYLRIATAGVGFVCYLLATVFVFVAVFLTERAGNAALQRKRQLATLSYGLFIVQVLVLAGIIFFNVLIERKALLTTSRSRSVNHWWEPIVVSKSCCPTVRSVDCAPNNEIEVAPPVSCFPVILFIIPTWSTTAGRSSA